MLSLRQKIAVFSTLFFCVHLQTVFIPNVITREVTPPTSTVPVRPQVSQFSIRTILPSAEGLRYEGTVDFEVSREKDTFNFSVIFIRSDQECSKDFCFYGYVEKYVQIFEGNREEVLGFENSDLPIKPIFYLETSGPGDLTVKTNPKLDQLWVDLIELACNSFNPALQEKQSPRTAFLVSSTDPRLASTPVASEYSYRTLNPRGSEEDRIIVEDLGGVREATLNTTLKFQDVTVNPSTLNGKIILRSDNLVSLSERSIQLNIGDKQALQDDREVDESDIELIDFQADINIKLRFVETIKILGLTFQNIKNQVESWNNYVLNKFSLPTARTFLLEDTSDREIEQVAFIPQLNIRAQQNPGLGDYPSFGNEAYTGVNTIQQFNKNPGTIFQASNTITIGGPRRNLQVVKTQNILNSEKVLYEKTILGKKFKVSFNTKCDLITYTYDVKLKCVGHVNVQYFGQSKSVKVFEFLKSVSFTWTKNYQKSGSWGASIWIGLPKPVNFIGLTLQISLKYNLNLDLAGSVYDTSPYTYQVKADLAAVLTTDSSASLRVGIFEGGVRIYGTLADLTSDLRVRAKFLFLQKKIEFRIIWNAKLKYFNAKWQIRYRRKKIFTGKWTSWKVILTKNITGGSKSWNLLDKTFQLGI